MTDQSQIALLGKTDLNSGLNHWFNRRSGTAEVRKRQSVYAAAGTRRRRQSFLMLRQPALCRG
jgi:hypothetical protein